MRSIRTALLAGGAVLALAGIIGVARAQTRPVAVALPGGGVVEIITTAPVTPQMVVVPTAAAGPNSPFAVLDRIAAEMDRQQEAMLREVQALAQMPTSIGVPVQAALGNLPPGVAGYSMVTTVSGNGVCTQRVQVTYGPGEARPQVVASHSGNCGAMPSATPIQPVAPVRQPAHIPGTLQVKNSAPQPPTRLVRQVADWNG